MRSFEILDIKGFMSLLLLSPAFDQFLLKEASVTTFCTFSIDGHLKSDYFTYSEEEKEAFAKQIYPFWEQARPFCLSLIKGKKPPSHMKLIFQLSPDKLERFFKTHRLSYKPSDVGGLYINVLYDGKRLSCTSGTALNLFTLDKSLEQLWDDAVSAFLKKHQLPFV